MLIMERGHLSDANVPQWYIEGDPDQLAVDVNWKEIPESARAKVCTLTNLVLTVIASLVDHETDVALKVSANHRRVMFTVHVNDKDVGLAIGGRGRGCPSCGMQLSAQHANALRTLLIAACRKLDFHFDMDIIGPNGEADWSSD